MEQAKDHIVKTVPADVPEAYLKWACSCGSSWTLFPESTIQTIVRWALAHNHEPEIHFYQNVLGLLVEFK